MNDSVCYQDILYTVLSVLWLYEQLCVEVCIDLLCVCVRVHVIYVSAFLNQLFTTISLMKNNCRWT